MKGGLGILSILVVLLLAFGCRKKDTAGTGGEFNLNITMRHHSLPIDTGKVYIKFNAIDAPSDLNVYDLNVDIVDGQAIFSGLQKGEYYLYGNGWDQTIVSTVEGGLPYEIKNGDKTIELNLQVTEDGH